MTAGRAVSAPASRASSITARSSARFTRRIRCLTGPMEAGRIDRLRRPIAARHNASIGRPASSPQKDSGVPVSAQRRTMVAMRSRKLTSSVS